ncbi:unnamed protein product [Bemisia tabaci]|uniref:BZIP domain-containing protein n=1 Tax=Bemisia tabaci TaxID=7038 RepID=A0A9P0F359_BEMTA|nr:PREDICTED: CCAAT/enhancer-binding protein gamma [Bemisia tabaci]CAH0390002.1 unnamed protein product [Bemisia tabaci]
MSPRNKEGSGSRCATKRKSVDQDPHPADLESSEDEYRKKRDRNNQAVKKSRVKSRLRTQETLQRVQELKSENDMLEEKIKLLSKELGFLKDLFLAHAGAAHGINLQEVDLDALLQDNTSTLLQIFDKPTSSTKDNRCS